MEIAWLEIDDPPELWRDIGYTVDGDGRCVVGGVEHRLLGHAGSTGGVLGWAVTGLSPQQAALVADGGIDGITTTVVDEHETGPTPEHSNKVFRIDHLVIGTSSTPRTVAALEAVGLSRRGGRTNNSAGEAVDMTFFWAGDTLLELAGPPTPDNAGKPARFSGIAYSSDDLDATVALLGDRSTTPVDAVQPGRRIAALTKTGGSSVPMAFMTPHIRTH